MNKKILLLIAIVMMSSYSLTAQVAVNTDGSSPDPSAMMDVSSDSMGILIPRMTETQRNTISNPETGLIIYQSDQIPGFYYFNGSAWTAVAGSGIHYPGELYGGGVIFWVDHTGQHGLIASMIDLGLGVDWSNVNGWTYAQSDWDGLSNSNAIVGQAGHTNSTAKICLDYVNEDYGTGVFSDWYLPARGELNDLWNNLTVVQKALDNYGSPATLLTLQYFYWSSTEAGGNSVWYFDFRYGSIDTYDKDFGYPTRAVRAF